MFGSARRAYESGAKSAPSGRELEAAALFKAARQLEACRTAWDAPDRGARLDEALRYNQRLWTFFQGEWLAEGCELPPDLRANLLRLSAFIDRRTFEMFARPTSDGVRALVEIDRHIAAGLSGQAEHEPATARAA
jgi:flagellar protein FlaF